MQQRIPRKRLVGEVQIRLRESPAVCLLGARQVGKTTLAHMVAEQWPDPVTFFDLETSAGYEALRNTPERTLGRCRGLVVVDEIQRMPELFRILRPLCDRPGKPAVFLLLGSASPDLVRGVSESLAGRVQFLDAHGLSLEEVGTDALDRLWFRGGFPPAFLAETDEAWQRWMDSFAMTFLERDIPALGWRVPSESLSRFWRMTAHFHGQVWNAAEVARSMDVSAPTANRYRDLLAGTCMIRVLPPWFENLGKRQVKSPKIYFRDSGLLHMLLGIRTQLDWVSHPKYGASWEGFALEQALIAHGARDAYFWATQRGAELDLLLIRVHRWGFEFKTVDGPKLTRSMGIAVSDLGLERLFVVYPGTQRYELADRVEALPLADVWKLNLTWK